jgi:hypothetical protein
MDAYPKNTGEPGIVLDERADAHQGKIERYTARFSKDRDLILQLALALFGCRRL